MKRGMSDFFIVANNADVFFNRPAAEYLVKEIKRRYGLEIPILEERYSNIIEDDELDKPQTPSWYEGIDIADFEALQETASKEIGQDQAKHLLWIRAKTFFGVYLPINIEPIRLELPKIQQSKVKFIKRVLRYILRVRPRPSEIDCASLYELKKELDLFATKMDLPTEKTKLESLSFDFSMIFLQTKKITALKCVKYAYAQLMLATKFAVEHNYPLWLR